MAIDFSYIDHDILGDVADAIRFVEGSTAGIAPADYSQRIRALDKYIPDYDVLNFYMPNGGTISLNKHGSPTIVELEYWLDENGQWLIWQPDSDGNRSLTLTAGQTIYMRNTSVVSTEFSVSVYNCYNFQFSSTTYANGNINSLLCKNPYNAMISASVFYGLFRNCSTLASAPEMPFENSAYRCYAYMYQNCTSLEESPVLRIKTPSADSYRMMFSGCSNLKKISTEMTNISAPNCLLYWVENVSPTGDFYCPAELTIPTGVHGIPSGWTRHDLT